MRMPLRRAMDIALECWAWLAETGEQKSMWPGWVTQDVWPDDNWCTLCMHAKEAGGFQDSLTLGTEGCPTCPLYDAFGGCRWTAFWTWHRARTVGGRKRAARRFLHELQHLDIILKAEGRYDKE